MSFFGSVISDDSYVIRLNKVIASNSIGLVATLIGVRMICYLLGMVGLSLAFIVAFKMYQRSNYCG